MTAERNDDLFSNFVTCDTVEAWVELKNQLKGKWLYLNSPETIFGFIEEETVEFGYDYDESKVVDAFEKFEVGRIWGEFQVEPLVQIFDGEDLRINKATYLALLDRIPSFTNLERLYIAENLSTEPFDSGDRFYYLWAACPRCYFSAKLDEDDEYLEWDEEFAIPGCPACDGSGEWEFET